MSDEVIIDARTMLDLVLVWCPISTQILLVQAPAWSKLEPNDSVVLDDESPAVVKSCITICKEDVAYGFILDLMRIKKPLKRIKSKVRYEDFHYSDEEEGAMDG